MGAFPMLNTYAKYNASTTLINIADFQKDTKKPTFNLRQALLTHETTRQFKTITKL